MGGSDTHRIIYDFMVSGHFHVYMANARDPAARPHLHVNCCGHREVEAQHTSDHTWPHRVNNTDEHQRCADGLGNTNEPTTSSKRELQKADAPSTHLRRSLLASQTRRKSSWMRSGTTVRRRTMNLVSEASDAHETRTRRRASTREREGIEAKDNNKKSTGCKSRPAPGI